MATKSRRAMTYEYACAACGHEWEAEQSIRAEPIRKCPKCNKLQAKRQISRGAGFILKGGGWYADGYGSSGGSSGGKSSSGDDGGTKAASETKTASEPKGDGGGDSKKSTTESKSKTVAA
jgi:putative FmdB family regulatory protein